MTGCGGGARTSPFACGNIAVFVPRAAVMGCTVGTPSKVKMMQKPSNGSIVCAQNAPSGADVITMVHFNDVYNVEEQEREPVGGAARFKTQVDSLQPLSPLVLFSGDALNPSNSQSLSPGSICCSMVQFFSPPLSSLLLLLPFPSFFFPPPPPLSLPTSEHSDSRRADDTCPECCGSACCRLRQP